MKINIIDNDNLRYSWSIQNYPCHYEGTYVDCWNERIDPRRNLVIYLSFFSTLYGNFLLHCSRFFCLECITHMATYMSSFTPSWTPWTQILCLGEPECPSRIQLYRVVYIDMSNDTCNPRSRKEITWLCQHDVSSVLFVYSLLYLEWAVELLPFS